MSVTSCIDTMDNTHIAVYLSLIARIAGKGSRKLHKIRTHNLQGSKDLKDLKINGYERLLRISQGTTRTDDDSSALPPSRMGRRDRRVSAIDRE